jgi:hypothetical protein
MMLKRCVRLLSNSPFGFFDLLDDLLAEFFSLLLLQYDHVIGSFTMNTRLVLK